MSRYQVYPPPGYLLLAAFAGALMVQTVLVELGIVSADGLDEVNGIIGLIGWVILFPPSVLLTGPLFLSGVYAVYGGGWRGAPVFMEGGGAVSQGRARRPVR